jgi:RNA 3'-terminal phosphate cyclase
MDNNEFENDMSRILEEGINNLFDAMAENVAKKIAKSIVEMVEEGLTDDVAKGRKTLIYMKIAEYLEKHVEKMSGEVKVE